MSFEECLRGSFESWYKEKFDYLQDLFIKDNPEEFNTDESYNEIEENQHFQDFVDKEYDKSMTQNNF